MNNSFINCRRISVDCFPNKKYKENNGEEKYVGFDFDVMENEVLDISNFVVSTLELFNIPYINMNYGDKRKINIKYILNKEKIFNAIKENAEYLKTNCEKSKSLKRSK